MEDQKCLTCSEEAPGFDILDGSVLLFPYVTAENLHNVNVRRSGKSRRLHAHIVENFYLLSQTVVDWMANNIQVHRYFNHFKGNFKGDQFD